MLALASARCAPNIVGAADGGPSRDAGGDTPDAADPNAYPAPGPKGYGFELDDVVPNVEFWGYLSRTPGQDAVDTTAYVAFGMDDARSEDDRFVLFNIGADWCLPCKQEARVLPGKVATWAPLGGTVMSVIIEDREFNPATRATLDTWVAQYQPNYTMLHDPEGHVQRWLAPATLPVNLIIALPSMKIVGASTGENAEFFDLFENRLKQ